MSVSSMAIPGTAPFGPTVGLVVERRDADRFHVTINAGPISVTGTFARAVLIELAREMAWVETDSTRDALGATEQAQEIWGVRYRDVETVAPFSHREDAENEVTRSRAFGVYAVLARADVVWTEVGPRKEPT